MQPQPDETVFNWIRRGRSELVVSQAPGWAGNFVSHLMPPVFEAYVKVLHRIEARYEDPCKSLTPSEISSLNIPPCDELKSLVERHRETAHGPRIKWREVAELLNVPFDAQINHQWYGKKLERGCWPRFLYGPGEGLLDKEDCSELASVLRMFSDGNGDCFFRFAEIPFIGTSKTLLFRGTLDELASFLQAGAYTVSPEYWWPPERTWCVCSDYDLEFTVVGGSEKLVLALLKSDVLECLEVMPQTRIDYLAPMP